MPRPADRGPAIPAIEAIVENDAVDRPRDGKVPFRRHGDAIDRQDIGIGPPHALDPAREFRVGLAREERMQAEARRYRPVLEILDRSCRR